MAKICMICGKELKEGKAAKVKDDAVIKTIRDLKRRLGIAQNNELYVCEKDLVTHEKKRKKFERDMVIVSTVALLIVLILIGLPLLMGRFDIGTTISAIFIGLIIVFILALFEYTPAVSKLEDVTAEQVRVGSPRKKSKRR